MLTTRTAANGVNPFRSFWMAGYECTDKLNRFGNRVDFLKVTDHLNRIEEDYQNLSFFGIKTVREGIRWSFVEKTPYQYDWTDVDTMIRAAKDNGIQQVWDLCHFGFPSDLTPLHPMFAQRFAAVSRAFVKFFRSRDADSTLIVTPINEVSFLSWLGGEVGGTSPYCCNFGWEVKYALMRAYIASIREMKEEDPSIRILTTEPLVNMVAPLDATIDVVEEAARQHENQFQVLDILYGRMCPELGGRPEYVDIAGCNFYYNNQWVINSSVFLPWINEPVPDPRWLPLSNLLKQAHERYDCPIVLAETSHPSVHRPEWTAFISGECARVLEQGIPLWGICWYPIIDRPDWDHMQPWTEAGVWDIEITADGSLERVLHEPTANALLAAQSKLAPLIRPSAVGTI